MDPLSPFGRNEPCWCGSRRKYKLCHAVPATRSVPGEPLPPDPEGAYFIAPHTAVAADAFTTSNVASVPVTIPTGQPEARPLQIAEDVAELLNDIPHGTYTPITLGTHRFEVFAHCGYTNPGPHRDREALAHGIRQLATASMSLLGSLSKTGRQPPTVLWSEDRDPARLLGQTLLWADHVCVGDQVFAAIVDGRSDEDVKDAVEEQLRLRPLIETGVVIPVPVDLVLAFRSAAVQKVTAADLRRPEIVEWVKSQLIFEGPTAREALFVTAQDDLTRTANFWLYSHVDRGKEDAEDGGRTFATKALQPYSPNRDYGPWKSLVADQATARFVQRLNERCLTGDLFAADYLTRSPFEARLLARKGRSLDSPAQAALWADVPVLPGADPRTLARAASEDAAVEDLRMLIRGALRTARTVGDRSDALTGLAEELAHAGRQLDRTLRTERRWQAVGPAAAGGAAIAVGAGGGLPAIAAGTLGVVGSLLPYVATHRNRKHQAAFIFYLAQRRGRRR